jgi:hypothetical protein
MATRDSAKNKKILKDARETGWARARALAEFAQANEIEANNGQTRAFLSKFPQFKGLVDGNLDRRNPTVRKMEECLKAFLHEGGFTVGRRNYTGDGTHEVLTSETRPSQGDPTRTARAGAPTIHKTRMGRPRKLSIEALEDLADYLNEANLTIENARAMLDSLEKFQF